MCGHWILLRFICRKIYDSSAVRSIIVTRSSRIDLDTKAPIKKERESEEKAIEAKEKEGEVEDKEKQKLKEEEEKKNVKKLSIYFLLEQFHWKKRQFEKKEWNCLSCDGSLQVLCLCVFYICDFFSDDRTSLVFGTCPNLESS